jgi:hypothetical protein
MYTGVSYVTFVTVRNRAKRFVFNSIAHIEPIEFTVEHFCRNRILDCRNCTFVADNLSMHRSTVLHDVTFEHFKKTDLSS